MITKFTNEHRFLSNFYPCKIYFEGLTYPSVEAAYQAAKTNDLKEREKFTDTTITAGKAKRMGRNLAIRQDWESVKLQIMEDLVRQKFHNHNLKFLLLSTGNQRLVEGNTWNATIVTGKQIGRAHV